MGCGNITIGSAADCENIPAGGMVAKIYAFNYDEVESFTESGDGTVTDLTLSVGADGYLFEGFRNDIKKSVEIVTPEAGLNQFKHGSGFVIYSRTQAQKNNIKKLARGRFIFVAENRGKDADAFEVLGKGVGLEIVAESIQNAYENAGLYVLNFMTPDDEFEPSLPNVFWDTSRAATIAKLESFLPGS